MSDFPQTVSIAARPLWNVTGIRLSSGVKYHLKANGVWKDWTIECTASGYRSSNIFLRASEWLRRAPNENWFALIGAFDSDEKTLFVIGEELTFVPRQSGILTCFANDIRLMYWNNSGTVELRVEIAT